MKQHDTNDPDATCPDDSTSAAAALRDKLTDLLTPGYRVEFDPDEAEQAGAFVEDALSEQDAAESSLDTTDDSVAATGGKGEGS